jgi:DtxR family Mn-dependent transcriptional regulator
MNRSISHNIQDYLKRIYEITLRKERASTTDLAEALSISAASVTNMLQKLSTTEPPYVIYHKHQGVALTPAGKQVALQMVRRHRLIEHYLVNKLGYTWDEVHSEAEILEHAMSPLLEKRMDAALGYPEFDPHGDPIPDADLLMPEIAEIALSKLAVGKSGTILRVPHEDPKILRYLGKSGLRPGAKIKLLSRTPYDQTMRVKINNQDEEALVGISLGEQIMLSV